MRPVLLFLSDFSNGNEDEDIIISNYLHQYFQVILCHPTDCEGVEDMVDEIIIRNTWNEKDYGKPSLGYKNRFRFKGLNVHDDLYKRPGEDKDYLLDLYRSGYPVIPTIDTIADLKQLPEAKEYFIKPKDGFDAIGARKIKKANLIKLNPAQYLIQPFVDFEYEISFYYLEKKLQYTMYAPDRIKRWDLVDYNPSKSDLKFAGQFIKWNLQKHGIERIDACRLKTGQLLLMEITDQGGAYLSLPLLKEVVKARFLINLEKSLLHRITQKRRLRRSN